MKTIDKSSETLKTALQFAKDEIAKLEKENARLKENVAYERSMATNYLITIGKLMGDLEDIRASYESLHKYIEDLCKETHELNESLDEALSMRSEDGV